MTNSSVLGWAGAGAGIGAMLLAEDRGAGALLGGIDVSGSLQTFSPATKTGEESGALFHAGLATLTMMEELRFSNRDLSGLSAFR
ncbi:MAG TPA: hypothetical protein VGQ39_00020 [Pyrinomonadaceae bacterium]|nr:hypothetical protein [Pyrinomonadaceae bacterium]